MASPWIPQQRATSERPWTGIALLAAIPLLALILVRMLWSGSSLWFLTVGIILLGAAAVIFLARRTQDQEYDRGTLAQETQRAPLILTALGVLFLAMLLLPNFSGGSDDEATVEQQSSPDLASDVAAGSQPPAQQAPAVQEQAPPAADGAGQTYTVQGGDNLWDIAQRFGTTVDAIVAANELANPAELQVGQELTIPADAGVVTP